MIRCFKDGTGHINQKQAVPVDAPDSAYQARLPGGIHDITKLDGSTNRAFRAILPKRPCDHERHDCSKETSHSFHLLKDLYFPNDHLTGKPPEGTKSLSHDGVRHPARIFARESSTD